MAKRLRRQAKARKASPAKVKKKRKPPSNGPLSREIALNLEATRAWEVERRVRLYTETRAFEITPEQKSRDLDLLTRWQEFELEEAQKHVFATDKSTLEGRWANFIHNQNNSPRLCPSMASGLIPCDSYHLAVA